LSDTDGDAVASEQATQSQTVAQQNPSHPDPTVLSRKPAAGRLQARAGELAARGALRNATINEPEPVTDSEVPSPGPKAAEASVAQPQPTSEISIQLQPQDAANAPDAAAMAPLFSTAAILPAADLAVSQGVTEATLVHNVLPIYPPQAHVIHLAGTVVLEETIADDGSTRDVKVISGPPLLAKAATEAVSQWRYRPSLLNGKPVAVQKQVTIVFKNP
jgi:TonB family protein